MAPKAIRDKSHTDMLAKMLGYFQVTWFAIQIIGRTANKLPVSLLEIHLSINIAFILATYIFWIQVRDTFPQTSSNESTRNLATSQSQLWQTNSCRMN